MRITVVTGSTNATELQGAITVKGIGARITALDNTASIAPDYDSLTAVQSACVRTINNVTPNSKGEFFLSGSDCTSWGVLEHGISLVDLCPACSDCELLYRLKQEVVRMKLWLTILRDVSLFSPGSATNTAYKLWLRRLQEQPNCGAYILGSTFSDYAKDEGYQKGLQLIQQYMTTVHMWNYLVNRNNKSDVIQVAPEDTAGFVVQTKRSVTECGNAVDSETGSMISCSVSITSCKAVNDDGSVHEELYMDGSITDYPVSVFVPRSVVEFTPFTNRTDADLDDKIGIPVIDTKERIVSNMKVDTYTIPSYNKKVYTEPLPIVAAGTYNVTVKFLPFVYSVMEDADDNPISIRGTTAKAVEPTEEDGEVIFQFYNHDTTPEPREDPTTEDYINSKTAPTCSVDFKLMWTIVIEWITTDKLGNINREEQTYNYVCNGIRRSYSSSVIDGSTIAIGGTTAQQGSNA